MNRSKLKIILGGVLALWCTAFSLGQATSLAIELDGRLIENLDSGSDERVGGQSESIRVDPARVLRQDDLDTKACGPVSLVHVLQFGDAACRKALGLLPGGTPAQRAAAVMERFGGKPSRDYGEGKRVRGDGISCVDLTDIAREVVTPAGLTATGDFLDRRKNEADRTFLHRVHRRLADALRTGRAPLVSLRSFATAVDSKMQDGYSWNGVQGHFVVVTRVPAKLADHELGFRFEFIDSKSGRVESGYIYLERRRAFLAAKGNSARYEWKRGSPFLLVTAPTLSLGVDAQPWWARSIVTLNYVITIEAAGEDQTHGEPE